LSNSTVICFPESESIVRRINCFLLPDSNEAKLAGADYRHQDFSWLDKALDMAAGLSQGYDQFDCYLLLSCPYQIERQGDKFLIPEYPVFEVSFGWARQRMKELWDNGKHYLAIVEKDYRAGVVIDAYCGYVEHDLNPDELAYKVALWE